MPTPTPRLSSPPFPGINPPAVGRGAGGRAGGGMGEGGGDQMLDAARTTGTIQTNTERCDAITDAIELIDG